MIMFIIVIVVSAKIIAIIKFIIMINFNFDFGLIILLETRYQLLKLILISVFFVIFTYFHQFIIIVQHFVAAIITIIILNLKV